MQAISTKTDHPGANYNTSNSLASNGVIPINLQSVDKITKKTFEDLYVNARQVSQPYYMVTCYKLKLKNSKIIPIFYDTIALIEEIKIKPNDRSLKKIFANSIILLVDCYTAVDSLDEPINGKILQSTDVPNTTHQWYHQYFLALNYNAVTEETLTSKVKAQQAFCKHYEEITNTLDTALDQLSTVSLLKNDPFSEKSKGLPPAIASEIDGLKENIQKVRDEYAAEYEKWFHSLNMLGLRGS